jgi:methionyl-tRNA formyltransferase
MRMTEGLDEGPILLRDQTPIGPDEDAGSLGARLAEMGGRLLIATLDGLASETVREHPQDDASATFAPKLTRDERRIDWARPAEDIILRVRAFAPEPGAVAAFRGTNLKILRAAVARVDAEPVSRVPGRVVVADGRPLVVSGSSPVGLLEVAPQGRRRMTGEEFVRGYRPTPDDVLT